jgi:hypothetical protein
MSELEKYILTEQRFNTVADQIIELNKKGALSYDAQKQLGQTIDKIIDCLKRLDNLLK